ncbi:tannase/feruloyl esterase family alpha/beta hydrolase [Streptomyces melanosporofaciens]|uniref:Feruloyl esterase n=1 Tax=Streptomyces melanosporofaciens TaxID=67327 RepID=A0A1H4KHY0_STRMJ|nr:tannase/feruloyl esterase family alpha/beta hydrolase [Streptomyces melanosporofaciens]SEB58140.1 feruloyl esterase [Streptomyces melanosporofaciens]
MRAALVRVLAAAVIVVPTLVSLPTTAGAATGPPTGCEKLAQLTIPAHALGLPTSGGRVTAAKTVPASGTGPGAIGEYCQVDAEILPVDPKAPNIEMSVALPVEWNGRAMMFGGGGYDGIIPAPIADVPFGGPGEGAPLARGFAVFGSDSGHQVTAGDANSGAFALNDEALRNFAADALKKTRDAAMFIINERYGEQPSHSYFAGVSSGGREALAVAQRWPRDFDGVISNAPAWNAATLDLFFGHMTEILRRPGAFPNSEKQKLVYDSVMKACDGDDGVRDGVISDEAGCHFDPKVLRCEDGEDRGPSCLSDAQIEAVRELSSPIKWGYKLGSGERGYPGMAFLSGADMGTSGLGIGSRVPDRPLDSTAAFAASFWDQWAKYFVTRDPDFDGLTFDPKKPGKWKKRISELTALQDINNPDLSEFAKAGGKLILVHGLADPAVSPRSTAEYYERVRTTMGPRGAAKFLRMYTIPGMGHGGPAAFTGGWDSVTALQRWAEKGIAPHEPVVTDLGPSADGRTRPLCQYPEWPRYNGRGDVDRAENFTCVRS